MPTRSTPPIGAPCWIELTTSDTERSRAFYSQALGWTAEEANAEFGGYFNFRHNGAQVAGCMPSQHGGGLANVWSIYLATDDARKTAEAAAAHGGTVHVPPMDVADLGTMAFVGDPSGAAIGIWQPKAFNGFDTYAETGAPGWFELHTRDYQAALAFYKDVFHWTTATMGDTPEFRYTVLQNGAEQLAGVMDASAFLPEGVPSHWSVYFAVDDADGTIEKIVQLGGSVIRPAEDTPYGRLAEVADPTGAHFKLLAPNEMMPARESSQASASGVTA